MGGGRGGTRGHVQVSGTRGMNGWGVGWGHHRGHVRVNGTRGMNGLVGGGHVWFMCRWGRVARGRGHQGPGVGPPLVPNPAPPLAIQKPAPNPQPPLLAS